MSGVWLGVDLTKNNHRKDTCFNSIGVVCLEYYLLLFLGSTINAIGEDLYMHFVR